MVITALWPSRSTMLGNGGVQRAIDSNDLLNNGKDASRQLSETASRLESRIDEVLQQETDEASTHQNLCKMEMMGCADTASTRAATGASARSRREAVEASHDSP